MRAHPVDVAVQDGVAAGPDADVADRWGSESVGRGAHRAVGGVPAATPVPTT
jgi:hypothetical protein